MKSMRSAVQVFVQRAFWVGLLVGVVGGAALLWWLDPRSAPSPDLRDARRASNAGKWPLAESILARYLRRFPEDHEAQILFARARAAQQDLRACLDQLARVPDTSLWAAEARLCEAQALQLSYYGARAEQKFRRAIELAESGSGNQQIADAARVGLAQLCALEVRPDEAREQMRHVLDTAIDPAAVLAVLLEFEAVGPEPELTIEVLRQFVENDATDYEARRALGHHYTIVGRPAEARPLLESFRRDRPDDPRSAEALAQCLIEIPDVSAARELLESVGAAEQERAWYWRLRGYLAEQDQDWSSAADCYSQAVRRAPHDAALHHLLGTALGRLERSDEAAEHLERAAALRTARKNLFDLYGKLMGTGVRVGGPGPDPELCFLIGVTCESLGFQEARAWFEEAVARQPNHAPSLAALKRLSQPDDQPGNSPTETP